MSKVRADNRQHESMLLEKLFEENFRGLCYFAYTFLKDRQEAEDVVQDAFMSLWSSIDTISGSPKSCLSWLYNTIRNRCLNVLRHRKVEETAETIISESQPEWHEEEMQNLIRSEVYKELYNAIEKLPAECRKIYKMTYFFKMSEREIADTLSLSVNSVKSQKQRGKELLRRTLGRILSIVLTF
jgi:RNA polymerase sigma-70 factor (family 1)